jgi:flagellar hook-basal body complex protein FliE
VDPISNLLSIAGGAATPDMSGLNPVSLGGAANAAGAATNPVGAASAFTQSLTDAVGSLSGLQTTADAAASGVAMNNGTDIHQAMIAMEQASMGMRLAVQVRDKAVEAYQTLMNMQM